MSEFREDDQAGNDVMQAFWKSPVGRIWRQKDQEAIKELQDKNKGMAMIFLLPTSEMKLERFESTKLEVIKHMKAFTAEELQASRSLGVASHDIKEVGGPHWTPEELEQVNEITNKLKELEEEFDTLLVNKYDRE